MKAVNLLPTDNTLTKQADTQQPKPRPDAKTLGPYIVIGVLAFAVIAVGASVLATNSVNNHKTKLADAKSERAQVEARADALAPYHNLAQLVSDRRETITELADSRFDWERSLRDLSKAIPPHITLTNITGTVSSAVAGGGSQIRAANSGPAIELTGCSSSQHLVARMMSNLSTIDGVTRVSLGKSDKDTQTTVTGPSKRELCAGVPTTFQVVLFFENTTAVPSATVSSVAPAQANVNQAAAAVNQTNNGNSNSSSSNSSSSSSSSGNNTQNSSSTSTSSGGTE